MNKISIIIPVLNEAKIISKLLSHLECSAVSIENVEVLVIDGGSTDGTINEVSNFMPIGALQIKIEPSAKGRAKQMNVGAKYATGSILYFLHADSFPPKEFDKLIFKQVEKGNLAGCFRMKFNSNHWWLKLAGWFTQFNWRICRGGDQSLFVTDELFETLMGFDESYTVCEDIDFIKKLYAENQFTVIPEILTTSSRCYKKHGVAKLQFHYLMIYLKKWLGASPEGLKDYYSKYIQ
jgi:rSAM/selenodomain-associated transferase 2